MEQNTQFASIGNHVLLKTAAPAYTIIAKPQDITNLENAVQMD
jgi:hypothetical protein